MNSYLGLTKLHLFSKVPFKICCWSISYPWNALEFPYLRFVGTLYMIMMINFEFVKNSNWKRKRKKKNWYSFNPYWTGGTYICPSLVKDGKDIYVPLLWHHCNVIWSVMHLLVQTKLLHCGQGAMSF